MDFWPKKPFQGMAEFYALKSGYWVCLISNSTKACGLKLHCGMHIDQDSGSNSQFHNSVTKMTNSGFLLRHQKASPQNLDYHQFQSSNVESFLSYLVQRQVDLSCIVNCTSTKILGASSKQSYVAEEIDSGLLLGQQKPLPQKTRLLRVSKSKHWVCLISHGTKACQHKLHCGLYTDSDTGLNPERSFVEVDLS